jgi:hypothetical protein
MNCSQPHVHAARFGVAVDPAYTEGAVYLKSIGINNPAEIAKVLDIAMNPNSLFIDVSAKRGGRNASVSLPHFEPCPQMVERHGGAHDRL